MHDFPSVEKEMVGNILINSPAVMLLDVSQMRTTTVTKNVSVSLKSVQPDGSHRMMNASCLRGTTLVESHNGVATFSDLALTSATKNVVLIFSFDLFECISEPLVITHGPASQIKITQQPNAVQFTGNPIVPFPEVMLYDSFGNLATSSSTLVRTCVSGAVDCDTTGPVSGGNEKTQPQGPSSSFDFI